MKITVGSDIHLEFGELTIKNNDESDVLILSGDIIVSCDFNPKEKEEWEDAYWSMKSEKFHRFFIQCSNEFKHVIYVMGNHEFYHGDVTLEFPKIKSMLEYLPNVYILENESIKIDDVTFIGGTMWTDMNKRDPKTLDYISYKMNDFNIIKNNGKIFTPNDAVAIHERFKEYLESTLNNEEKFVVVTHHSPSRRSTKPIHQKDYLMNGGYSSSLDDYILEHPEIKLWTHGHTHYQFDYMIGETRIFCNPRGYIGHEIHASNFEFKTVEI